MKRIIYNLRNSNLIWLVRNLINFRKELYSFRPWDWSCSLEIFGRGLTELEKCMKEGADLDSEQYMLSEELKELITELNKIIKEDWIGEAEKELNLKYPEHKLIKVIKTGCFKISDLDVEEEKIVNAITNRSDELEKQSKEKFFALLKGDMKNNGLFTWWD